VEINATLLGQAITFAILVLFTMKFVWPPLNNMMEERAQRIADGLSAAEAGKQELLNAKVRAVEELRHVQMRATEIVANAEKRSEQMIDEAVAIAAAESSKILLDAKAQAQQEFLRVKEELRATVAALVIKGAEHILRAEIDANRHEKILANIKAEL